MNLFQMVSRKCFSRNHDGQKGYINLYPLGQDLFAADLGIGTTLASFHRKMMYAPLVMKILKRCVNEGAMVSAIGFNILADMPSDSFDFDESSPLIR